MVHSLDEKHNIKGGNCTVLTSVCFASKNKTNKSSANSLPNYLFKNQNSDKEFFFKERESVIRNVFMSKVLLSVS